MYFPVDNNGKKECDFYYVSHYFTFPSTYIMIAKTEVKNTTRYDFNSANRLLQFSFLSPPPFSLYTSPFSCHSNDVILLMWKVQELYKKRRGCKLPLQCMWD